MRDLPQNFVEGESKGLRSRVPPAADAARRSRGSGRRAQAPLKARAAGCGNRNPLNRSVRHRRARLLPLLQRVEKLDTLRFHAPWLGSCMASSAFLIRFNRLVAWRG